MAKDVKMSVVIEGNSKQLQAAMAAAAGSTETASKTISGSLRTIGKSMAVAGVCGSNIGCGNHRDVYQEISWNIFRVLKLL